MSTDGPPAWWKRARAILEQELNAFHERGLTDFAVDDEEKANGRIVLRGTAQVAPNERREIVVVYPDSFPHTRVAIFAPGLDLPRHQNPFTGNLCVLPRSSNHWRPSMRAADLVAEQVPFLVSRVREGGTALAEVEEPQGEPVSVYFGYLATGGIVIPEAALDSLGENEAGRLSITFRDDDLWLTTAFADTAPDLSPLGQALVTHVTDKNGATLAKADEALSRVFRGRTWHGRWVRLDEPPKSATGVEILREVTANHQALEKRKFENKGFELLAVVFREEVRLGEWGDTFVFVIVAKHGKTHQGPHPVQLVRGMPYGPAVLAERIPELSPLRSKTVGILGLGTLGSSVAHELARSQAGHLKLADDDHVEAATAVRWDLGIETAGAWKILALEKVLGDSYPLVRITSHPLRIGDTSLENPVVCERELLEQWVAGCDLLIDVTAEQNVRRVIAFRAHPAGMPQIFAWSIDAYGGVAALLRPNETGCLLCLERALSPSEGWITPPLAANESERVQVQPRGCGDRTFTGASFDLAAVSNQVVRLAAAALCSSDADGYAPPDEDVFVLKIREPDGRLCAPTWTGYKLPVAGDECQLCSMTA